MIMRQFIAFIKKEFYHIFRDRRTMLILLGIPAIICAIMKFGFSGQNGENSGDLSRKAAGIIVDSADSVHLVDVRWNGRQELIDKIELPVRKAAHMTEYAIFACLVYLAFTVDGVSWQLVRFISFFATAAFACSDEFHQLYVPGRNGCVTDVLIDCVGILIGIIICSIVDRRKKMII